MTTKGAVWISLSVFAFSIVLSTPFTIYTRLVNYEEITGFEGPGAYDYIAYCIEDTRQDQIGQVITYIS